MYFTSLQPPARQFRFPTQLQPRDSVGYSCQTRLSEAIRGHFDQAVRATYYLWFSKELYPDDVDLTSSPLHVYEDLMVAVRKRSTSHPKIQNLRLKYQTAIRLGVSDRTEQGKLITRVYYADVTWFRPVVLKIDLQGLDLSQCRANAIMNGGSPGMRDEYKAPNLDAHRCTVIVD